jgi:hypothetical protein
VDSVGRDIELDRAVSDHGRGGSVFALSGVTHGLCIAEENGTKWVTDNYSLMPILGHYRASGWRPGGYHTWDRMPDAERQFLSRVVLDLDRARPTLLLVEKLTPSPKMVGFDYLEYMRREPRFPKIMARYRFVREFKHYQLYELETNQGHELDTARGDAPPNSPDRR